MEKTIGSKTYNTDSATFVAVKHVGYYGDPYGYEEKLFKQAEGDYFFFGQGGPHSFYSEADLRPADIEQAKAWLAELRGSEVAEREFAQAVAAVNTPIETVVAPAETEAVAPAKKAAAKKPAAGKEPVAEKKVASGKKAAAAAKVEAAEEKAPAAAKARTTRKPRKNTAQ